MEVCRQLRGTCNIGQASYKNRKLPGVSRALNGCEVGAKNRAAGVRPSKWDELVTCEEVHAPRCITHRKDWLSLHPGNLDGEDQATERTVEDFLLGVFPGCLPDRLILKHQANQVEICALVLRQLPAHRFYFLVGYGESLLSHF
nr:small ribosomal subunit protein uS3m-like [Kogia breviceps]